MKSKDRVSLLQIFQFVAVGLSLVWPALVSAQTVVATIPLGATRPAVAVNPVTNKIYVASCTRYGLNGPVGGPVAVIDGQTNAFTTYTGGVGCASAFVVNPATNKIYSIIGENVAMIDGATNAASMTTVADSNGPEAVAVNPVTNKIYVANKSGNVSVIDGATNSITTIADPNANGLSAVAIAVNPVTNKIYVANNSGGGPNPGSVTVIDGATNSTTTVTDPNAISPNSLAVNSTTNKIYVANGGDYPGLNHGNITVIDGATNAITTLSDPNVLDPLAVAVNETTNKIYVANANDSVLSGNGGVTAIDGATNVLSTVKDPNAIYPHALTVDSVTNTIYVANGGCSFLNGCSNPGSVTVINGATGTATTIIDPNASAPNAVALNPKTNKIYVPNSLSSNTTVIDGGSAATSHILSILTAGNGLGSVTSNPAGINCGMSCTASFASGTAVSLTDSPASGSSFSGWSTSCTGSSACNLTMSSDGFVTATFDTTVPPDFSLQPASASLTVQRGSQVTDLIAIAPVAGTAFRSPVQLSCVVTGPAPMPICTLSSTSVTPGANSATSTLTVGVPSQSAGLIPSNEGQLSSPLYAVLLPIPLALIGFGLTSSKSKQRKHLLWLVSSLLIAFVALQAGCGGGSSNQTTPPLNYTATVTATSGAIQHTTQVSVTVP